MYILNNRYKICDLLNSGGFGKIYNGIDLLNDNKIAIKIEEKQKYLQNESDVYDKIKGIKNMAIKYDFINTNNKSYLIMPLYYNSSDRFIKINSKYFNEKDILMLGIQILQQLNNLHKCEVIHNDIKPDNFIFDKNTNKFKLIDFGLSKVYIINDKHINFSKKCSRYGTLRYMTINAHKRYSLSRRDDLISLSYSLIYLFYRTLPWKGIVDKNISKKKIHISLIEKKSQYNKDILRNNIISPILSLFNYSSKLSFDKKPDYNYLIKGFYNYLKFKNYKYDGRWSWSKDI
tara:strand:+ start:1345 stop:2211 length:867 start_codon:yes stop_codon:yes gene_type:complete